MTVTINGTSGVTFPDSSTQAVGFYGFKNRIINGAMVIDQRNAGASTTPTDYSYSLDRWESSVSQASKFTIQQTPSATETGYATRVAAGFTNYLAATSSSAYSVGAGDIFRIFQNIEGFNTADLAWGTSSAKTVTLSFWVYSSLTGTFGGSINNSAQNRSYPFSYVINSANTWEQKSVTIAGDTSGTWVGATNGVGIRVSWSIGAGSSYSGTAGAWVGSTIYSVTGATSVVGTSSATFYITGVQLEKGSTATSFDYRPYGTELMLCQRYFELMDFSDLANASICNSTQWSVSNDQWGNISYKVLKRATPSATSVGTVILYGGGSSSTTTPTLQYIGQNGLCLRAQPASYAQNCAFIGNSSGFKLSVSAEL